MGSAATDTFGTAASNLRFADTSLVDMAADYDDHDEQAADLFHSLKAGH